MNGVNHENGGGGGRVTSKTAPARLEQLDSEDDEDNILFKVLTNPTFPSALFCMHDDFLYFATLRKYFLYSFMLDNKGTDHFIYS